MTLREIRTIPNPVLRRKAHPVTKFDNDLKELIDDMVDTMREAPGVGLAAPQVGVSLRVIVVEYTIDEQDEESPKKLFTLVNPEIKDSSSDLVLGIEGCLSLPGLQGEVERSQSITLKALNRHGSPVRIKAQGWLARIFQHEIDHLDGIVFTDKASRIWKPEPEDTLADYV
jgi:peptide deformylase